MRPFSIPDQCPAVAVEEQQADELLKRIRKLRWIGLDKEARDLEMASSQILPVNAVQTGRFDTD